MPPHQLPPFCHRFPFFRQEGWSKQDVALPFPTSLLTWSQPSVKRKESPDWVGLTGFDSLEANLNSHNLNFDLALYVLSHTPNMNTSAGTPQLLAPNRSTEDIKGCGSLTLCVFESGEWEWCVWCVCVFWGPTEGQHHNLSLKALNWNSLVWYWPMLSKFYETDTFYSSGRVAFQNFWWFFEGRVIIKLF